LAAAWAISDAVLQHRVAAGEVCWRWPRHLQFIWGGQPLADQRVLVRCYHGLGDTIQFLRFMRPLRAVARHVSVWVQPQLLELAVTACGVDEVTALHDGSPDVDYDVDLEIMEVPHALRTRSIPSEVPYLSRSDARPTRKDAIRRIGVVWTAGEWDPRRNIPIDLLAPITLIPEVHLFSLQLEPSPQLPRLLPCDCNTVSKTAERMLEFDLIITVDTMTAHLAGALARPTWVLLHADCDWRWGEDETRTAWYPTVRLFRQRRAGDWSEVIGCVRDALTGAAWMGPGPRAGFVRPSQPA
jgi:hypothetical protein